MKKLAHQQAGELGEALALAKLNSLGRAAYASPTGAPGHDLMVVVNGRSLSIEVKTRQFIDRETEITRWPVLMSTKGDADLFLFVALNITTMQPTFTCLPMSRRGYATSQTRTAKDQEIVFPVQSEPPLERTTSGH